jgi:hypothetical protein
MNSKEHNSSSEADRRATGQKTPQSDFFHMKILFCKLYSTNKHRSAEQTLALKYTD